MATDKSKASKKARPPRSAATGGGAGRVSVIQAIKVPLNFFVLFVLVTEGILGALAPSAGPTLKAWIIGVMLAMLVAVGFIVAYMAIKYPDQLLGRPVVSPNNSIEKGRAVIVKAPSRKNIVRANGVVKWNKDMDKFIGHSAVVKSLNKDMQTAKLDVDEEKYEWSLEWIEAK